MSGEESDRGSAGEAAERGSPPPEGEGVLGRLPRTRPTVRSPRRQSDPEEAARTARASPAHPEEPPASTAELEALARAGLAAAGSAATVGARIAIRAAAALRDTIERR